MNDNEYYKNQILTYMGNKRKFLTLIESIVDKIQKDLHRPISIGEGFTGSGIVSRLFKNKTNNLYVNDIASYSKTLNECYLSTISDKQKDIIHKYIDIANQYVELDHKVPMFIQKYWSPSNEIISEKDRVYFTYENGKRIDKYMYFIKEKVPKELRCYLLAPLLIECSIHNNTSGQFSAYYKNKSTGKGKYGGDKELDLNRITGTIKIPYPILSQSKCDVNISQMDTNMWITKIPKLDLVYYDPPYNKHPYCIYYFLLDIINNWDINIEVPNTNRGQPKNWLKSDYCSIKKAEKCFEDLIKNTNSNFILLSYNNGGIISLNKLEEILNKYGKISKIPVEHKTYNKMKGIANYKRKKENIKINEYLWLLDKR